MGLLYATVIPLTAENSVYRCECATDISSSESVISNQFTGKHGDALFVSHVCNVTLDDEEWRYMTSGRYGVSTIRCAQCGTDVGWKYVKSEDTSQTYKVGKYVIEKGILDEYVLNDNRPSQITDDIIWKSY
ncbi:Moh1 protein [Martiniozyma asiatica (nom. inval.)]|nr:Moh1 protein [Martiniozyma asiatica]